MMSVGLPEHDWKSGSINFSLVPCTAAGLSMLIDSGSDVPIRRSVRPGTFPSFKAARFSLVQNYGYIINIWRVRNAVENFHVIGGVKGAADSQDDYISQKMLNDVLASEGSSQRALITSSPTVFYTGDSACLQRKQALVPLQRLRFVVSR